MNKKTKAKLNETLNKALEAPKKRDLSKLDALLNPYDVPEIKSSEIIQADQLEILSRDKQDGVSVSKSKQDEVWVSKSKQGEVRVSKIKKEKLTTKIETSPSKNFTKVSNFINHAIPEKYFRGLSKHTYDVLYQKTRGAITPVRTIQLTKQELVALTGLSKDAVKLHIKYLKESGLVASRPAIGSHAGWEYEVFVPEEIDLEVNVSKDKTGEVSVSKWRQNLPLHSTQNLPLLTHTNFLENKGLNSSLKTFFKDFKDDGDETREALADFIEKFEKVTIKITSKKLSKSEKAKWGNLADLLILELEIAAKRTGEISSVPSFLTEVLRRRLFAGREVVKTKIPERKLDTIGKTDENGEFTIKPLDEEGRRAAITLLTDFRDDQVLKDFKKWYVEEDWQWLMKELGKI